MLVDRRGGNWRHDRDALQGFVRPLVQKLVGMMMMAEMKHFEALQWSAGSIERHLSKAGDPEYQGQ